MRERQAMQRRIRVTIALRRLDPREVQPKPQAEVKAAA
jgi:hypothetical protein